jgi:hypothetical protein
LVTGFIEHLQFVTKSNSSAIANSHALQFTIASNKSSHSAVFSGCLVTASHAVAPSASVFHGSRSRWLASMSQQPRTRTGLCACRLSLDWFASKSKSELLYDWLFTTNQFVLESSLSRLTTRDVTLVFAI